MRWVNEVKNSVSGVYGLSRADAVQIHLSSMLWKIMLADYHAEQSKEVIREQYTERTHNELYKAMKNIILSATGAEEAGDFRLSLFVSEAHTIAFAQSLHSAADILAQAIYLSLDLDKNLSKTIDARRRNLSMLRDGMKKAKYAPNVANAIGIFLDLQEFKYLHEYTNMTKHHSLLDASYGVSLVQNQHGIRISAFEGWQRKWSKEFVTDDFEVIKDGINQIGIEMSLFLRT
jgi:hypothetical protein